MTEQKKTNKVTDMTKGSPLRLILLFTIPLLIGDIFQQLYTMADTMVVGYELGDSAIAAIGGVAPLYNLVLYFSIGLNNGYQIILTQKFGAGEQKAIKQVIAGMLLLNTGITLFLTGLSLATLHPMLRFLNIPSSIMEDAYAYIFVILAGMLCTIFYNMFASILRAVGNSRVPLYFLILASLLNVVLDILFVMNFKWGLVGAAGATILAQAIAAVLCGIYIWKNYQELLPEKEDFKVPATILKALLATGMSMALMEGIVSLGSIIYQRATNAFGETIMVSYTSARKLIDMMMRPMNSLATANCIFAGQNWGAKQMDRIHEGLRKVLVVEMIWSVVAFAVIFLFGGQLIRFTTGTTDTTVIANGVLSLRIHLSCYPFLGVLFCLRNVMQAMGQKLAPIISSGIELAMKIFASSFLIPKLGFLGTCVTEPVTWILMMIFLLVAYMKQNKAYKREVNADETDLL